MNILNSLPIQILCLDKRWELWPELIVSCKRLSEEVHPFLVGDGEIFPKNMYDKINWPKEKMGQWGYGATELSRWRHWNASISHRIMIQKAKDNKWKSFLMIEDDAYITKRFEKVWKTASYAVPDFDLLYLGWWVGDENDEYNVQLEKNYNEQSFVRFYPSVQIGGLHGVIINESMYDRILQFPWTNPIDMQLNNLHKQIKSYYISPKIIHVKNVHSNCEGCTFIRKEL